tara:strand:- start:630 stop:917 length:288 start_codon:yes stop_codon:yes gene_type:complete
MGKVWPRDFEVERKPYEPKSYHKGISCLHVDPGTVDEAYCRACGAKMDVKRNVMTQRSMYGKKHLSDSFHCPNVGKRGHFAKLVKKFPQWKNGGL